MSITLCQDVLMVVPEHTIESHLEEAANRNGWPLVQGLPIPQILREVVMHNPRVVVVQIGRLLEQSMNLIGALRQLRPGTRVIAASVTHHELIEQATRCAGATCYLPDASDLPLLSAWGTGYQLGPGTIHVAHTDHEQIPVAELRAGVDRYVALVRTLLAGDAR